MDFLTAPRGDLIRLIYDLIDQNNLLKAQLAEVKARLGQKETSKEKSGNDLPSFVKPNVRKRKKKTVRKKRKENFARKKDIPTKKVFHSFNTCPDCGGSLGKPSVCFTRQIIDIPLPRVEVTEHVVFKRWCLNCQKRVYPKINLAGITVGKQRFGINLTSLVATLNEEFLQPLNKVKNFLKITYQLKISEGGLVRLLKAVRNRGQTDYERIKTNLKRSAVVYADETGSRENGHNGYQWSFSNQDYQLVWYHRRRNTEVVRDFIGPEERKDSFAGIMVSDFLGSYNEYNGFHQRCWVHLLRDIKTKKKEYRGRHPPLNIWAKKVRIIYQEAKQWSGPDPDLPLGLQAQIRAKKENYFKNRLREVCEREVTRDLPMSTLSARAIKHLSELFTFIRFPGVEPDNNRAERALRHSVVKRKISGGTRSEEGSRTREILASLFGTWRLQGLNPLEQTKLLLAKSPCQRK